MMNKTGRFKIYTLVLLAIAFGISSCRTARDVPSERLKPVSAERLLKQVEQNAFDYNDLTIRRINVQFSNDGIKTSFRANLRASKDEMILASFSKLNIPVGRVLLTPDSVKYVNFIDRNYLMDDYNWLSNVLNIGVSFDIVQAILSNPLKNGAVSSSGVLNNFEVLVENGRYVLQSDSHLNNFHPERKKITVRNNRHLQNRGTNNDMVLRKMVIHPRSYVLEKIVMDDPVNDKKLEVDFSDFVKVDNKDYPGEIDVRMFSEGELTELNVKLRGFSTEKIDSVELNIPERYQRIRIR
jgi:hypothetical protein